MTAFLISSEYLIATVITVAIVFLALLIRYKYRRYQQQSLSSLRHLTTILFSCITSTDYVGNKELFERRVHHQKMRCINKLASLRFPEAMDKELLLFDILVDIGQIRRRVTDHTIFELCEKELTALAAAIDELFYAIQTKQNIEPNLAAYAHAINEFEGLFEHVIKVAAREPLMFVLFISALRSLLQYSREISGLEEVLYLNESVRLLVLDYPEWVFVPKFNRYLNRSTSELKTRLGGIADALFALDYLVRQPINSDLRQEILPSLAQVNSQNNHLLRLIYAYFAKEPMPEITDNLMSDVNDMQQSIRVALPDSIELLDLSPDYLIITALARNLSDIREILLKILADLPIDKQAAIS